MDNSLIKKPDTKEERKLKKKVKSLQKKGMLEEHVEIKDSESNEVVTTTGPSIPSTGITCDRTGADKALKQDKFLHHAVICNLPSEASKEELINFLSNRGIPVDGVVLNDNNYAIVECEDVDTLSKINSLLKKKPMENNKEMSASVLSGNPLKLSKFASKVSVPNKRFVVVKNISIDTSIETILAALKKRSEIMKFSSVEVRHCDEKTQMLTIEFKNASHTEIIISKINGTMVDGRQLTAEFKQNLVDAASIEGGVQSDTLIIRNLPLNSDQESLKVLLPNMNVSPANIHFATKFGKSMCLIKFKNVEEASQAFERLREETLEEVKLELKYLVTEEDDGSLDRTRLTLTNLPFTVKKEDIDAEFEMAQSVKLPVGAGGKAKGVCYLTFKSAEVAALALDSVQDKVVCGRSIKCKYPPRGAQEEREARPVVKERVRPTKAEGAVLTLFNLPNGVKQKDITEHFKNVTLVNIVKKGDSFRGIAEVHFKDAEAAAVAMAVPEFSMRGRVIRKEVKGGRWRVGTVPKATKTVKVKSDKIEKSSSEGSDAESMET